MTAVQFYHLTSTALERALPRLLDKAYQAGERAVVRVGNQAMLEVLNTSLWTYDQGSFLPHGAAKDGDAALQPIYLTEPGETAEPNGTSPAVACPNKASLLVVTDGAVISEPGPFKRLIDIFDGTDAECAAAARTRLESYRAAGFSVTYLQQTPAGWETVEAVRAA